MNVYGNTCPMCCGDLDDVAYLRTGAALCLSCGSNLGAPAPMPVTAQRLDETALTLNAIPINDLAMAQAPFRLDKALAGTSGFSQAPPQPTELTTH